MAPMDKTRSDASRRILGLLERGSPPPWLIPAVLGPGPPRNGSTLHVYGGINPLLLWLAAAEQDATSNLWYTATAAERRRATLRNGVPATRILGGEVYNHAAFHGLPPAPPRPSAEITVRRVADLLGFLGVEVTEGPKVAYDFVLDAITVESGATLMTPAGCARILPALVWWARRRLGASTDGAGWLVAELGGALLCAWLQLEAAPPEAGPWATTHGDVLREAPESLWAAFDGAQEAVRFLQDLAPQPLVDELEAAARGVIPDPEDDSTADLVGNAHEGVSGSAEPVRSLGDLLVVEVDDLERHEEVASRPKRLVLGERPGKALYAFLEDLGTPDLGRRRPPVVGWLNGGAGTGRVQVLAALRGLVEHGGTDLTAPWLDTEGDSGALLDALGTVWARPWIEVVSCRLASRFHIRHDRAIPTACLQAFHASRGLSNRLWLARLEHVLHRNQGFGAFVKAFEALAGVRWSGEANLNPIPYKERLITALGGAPAGARRRVRHYQSTRKEASWDALFEEVSTTLAATAGARGWTEGSPEPRVLFLVDVSTAEHERDPAAAGWLGRALAPVADLMDELATRGTRPFWFLFSSEHPVHELAALAGWDKGHRRVRHVADLDRHPVTSAFNQELLAKRPEHARPMYALWAHHRRTLAEIARLEGYATPVPDDREGFLASYPFLPPVLPVAQAVLDTLVSDPSEADPRPLNALVEHALAEHYYAPPDRFIPFDVLLEPVLDRLRALGQSRQPAAVRVMVPFAHRPERVFTHETVLSTLRLANRAPDFPCTARNLVSLMYVRPQHPIDELVAEVEATLAELAARRFVRPRDGRYEWVQDL